MSSANLVPRKRLRVSVVLINEVGDIGLQSSSAAVNTAQDLLFDEQGEEALDLIEPG